MVVSFLEVLEQSAHEIILELRHVEHRECVCKLVQKLHMLAPEADLTMNVLIKCKKLRQKLLIGNFCLVFRLDQVCFVNFGLLNNFVVWH